MTCPDTFTESKFLRAALMWNAGKGTLQIARMIGMKESDVYKHIDAIKFAAIEKREKIARNSPFPQRMFTRRVFTRLIPYAGYENGDT